MEQTGKHSIVRHWTYEDAKNELSKIKDQIESEGMTVGELRYRAEEWDLDRNERMMLERYEKFLGMINFAKQSMSD